MLVTEVVCCIVVRTPRIGNFAPCGKNAKLLIVSPHVPTKEIQEIRDRMGQRSFYTIFLLFTNCTVNF